MSNELEFVCARPRRDPRVPKLLRAETPSCRNSSEFSHRELMISCSASQPSGDMLRQAVKDETEVGMKAKGFMDEVRL